MPTQSDMMRVSQRNEISPNADGVLNATRWKCKLPSNGELRPVTALQLANIKADLHRYLRKKKTLVSPEFSAVVADVGAFTSAVVRDGFEKAFSQLPNVVPALSGRPFIEMAETIAEHHLRFVQGSQRALIRKSLLEAYIHAAGPEHVFGPLGQTRLVRALRRSAPRNFAAMLFSLHLFNVMAMAIQDEVRTKMPDVASFELYMLGVETICQGVVKTAVESEEKTEVDEAWAKAVAMAIDAQLLHIPLNPNQRQESTHVSGHKE